ncbi:MAG: hypothetical protein MUE85_16845 [Microscillaceae bacterium]|jgi:hypothetical protein|nr:hypothetical protein [Microscillaceae bacterium]
MIHYDFFNLLKTILGQIAWGFRFGYSTGSIFTFEFGNKIPLNNEDEPQCARVGNTVLGFQA